MTQPPKYAQQYLVKDNCLFETGKNTSKKLFWISMIPSLILVVWELTRHIWLLG